MKTFSYMAQIPSDVTRSLNDLNPPSGLSRHLPPPPPMPTPIPPLPHTWDGTEDMKVWLNAKMEEDRRKQEEARTQQEQMKLERRRWECSLLSKSISAGVAPNLIPQIFSSAYSRGTNPPFAAKLQRLYAQLHRNAVANRSAPVPANVQPPAVPQQHAHPGTAVHARLPVRVVPYGPTARLPGMPQQHTDLGAPMPTRPRALVEPRLRAQLPGMPPQQAYTGTEMRARPPAPVEPPMQHAGHPENAVPARPHFSAVPPQRPVQQLSLQSQQVPRSQSPPTAISNPPGMTQSVSSGAKLDGHQPRSCSVNRQPREQPETEKDELADKNTVDSDSAQNHAATGPTLSPVQLPLYSPSAFPRASWKEWKPTLAPLEIHYHTPLELKQYQSQSESPMTISSHGPSSAGSATQRVERWSTGSKRKNNESQERVPPPSARLNEPVFVRRDLDKPPHDQNEQQDDISSSYDSCVYDAESSKQPSISSRSSVDIPSQTLGQDTQNRPLHIVISSDSSYISILGEMASPMERE
ncbi:uncharacterized protein N7515_006465 [Penicillium bovifimosum]|uniref:Uncharacterized protein n=1 Tax=Penicillium bovifimosum TaxID=126998 RepID=A0A9W9GUZ9_9EURO|nr:uncharacterized protein N7515_006465 [Penicillium bovifimosum]KAJ5130426.1 hypothetical protein N7515_006465 [Penicillium bovifimosum]